MILSDVEIKLENNPVVFYDWVYFYDSMGYVRRVKCGIKNIQGNQETEVLTGSNTEPQNPSTAGMNKPNN